MSPPTTTPLPASSAGSELAWLAGLIEGEGSFHFSEKPRPSGNGVRFLFAVSVSMTDEDVILRAHRIAGCGAVHGPHGPYSTAKRGNRLPQWRWAVWRREEARAISERLLPLMGVRRQAQIRALLDAEERAPRPPPLRCATVAGYKAGCRCSECRRAWAKRGRDQRRRRRERAQAT